MKLILCTLTACLICFNNGLSHAATTDVLLAMELAASDRREVVMLTVNYEPGEFSIPHRHDAHTFVYVIDGKIEMQVRGGELKQLGPGDTFYENPDDVHLISRNISETATARFLVFFIKAPGTPVSTPVADTHH